LAKNKKKIIAIVSALALLVAAVPVMSQATGVDSDNDATSTSDATSSTDASSKKKEEENTNKIKSDGEVVQDGAVGKVDKSKWITLKDYKLVAENDTYKMFLYEPRLSIMLQNKKTGKIMESTLSDEKDDGNSNSVWNGYMKSGIVINAIKDAKNTYQVDLINNQNTINVNKESDGFTADIYFDEYQFGLSVNVKLDGEDVVVSVPDKSIKEDADGIYISTVSLFPLMGYTYLDDEEGYMLIPDGNGALINLDNKEGRYTTGFSQNIYGSDAGFDDSEVKTYLWDKIDMVEDANEVTAPIFGMAHTKQQLGYIAVVESGDKRASIEAHPNGVMVNYNRCFAKFKLRDIYVQPLNNSNSGTVTKAEEKRTHMDMTVRYMMLSGDDANYSAMAAKYRNYLLDNGLVTKKDDSYNTRVDFLGTDREEFLVGTRAVTMTTTENISDIFGELKKNGVASLISMYKGWQKGGLYNVPVTKYKADRHIGGTGKLTKLIKDSAKDNYQLYLYNDALRLNPSTNKLTYDMIKQVNKRTFKEEEKKEVYDTFYYLTPSKANEDLSELVSSYTDDGVKNLAIAGLSNTIFSYSLKGKFYTRNDTANDNIKLIGDVAKKTNLVLEQPVSYLWKDTNAFLDMPLGSSDYMYVDEEIPFLSMVLKGIIPMYSNYVNFEANKQEFLLQMVEAGVYPSFYVTYENSSDLIYTNSSDLYSTEYKTYKDTIVKYDKDLRKLNEVTKGSVIKKHEKLNNGVTVVTYDNGTKIYVNYTSVSRTVDGVKVGAMSYSYKAGETE